MDLKKILLAVFGIMTLGGIAYVSLGGFEKPEYSLTDNTEPFILAAAYFEGATGDRAFVEAMSSAANLIQNGKIPGKHLAVVFEGEANDTKRRVKAWMGAIVADSSAILPKGYAYKTIPSFKAAGARIKTLAFVAPSPTKVREELEKLAAAKGLALDTFYVEKYLGNEEIENWVRVK